MLNLILDAKLFLKEASYNKWNILLGILNYKYL